MKRQGGGEAGRPHVLLLTHGSAGDVEPFLAMGRALRRHGHAVTLVTHAPYEKAARDASLGFHAIDTPDQYERQRRSTIDLLELASRYDPARLLGFYEDNAIFEKVGRECDFLVRQHRASPAVVLAHHTSGLSALLGREIAGIATAWIAVTPMQVLSLPLTAALHRDVLSRPINELRSRLGLRPVRNWGAWLGSADRTIGLWPSWFDAAGPRAPSDVELVGFVDDDETDWGGIPPGVGDVLTSRPVLVLGTTGGMARSEFYVTAIEGARAAGHDVVVISPDRDLLPRRLPHGTHWVPRLPVARVLPQVACLIHHGGIGTTVCALRAGVPQVVLPFGFDRPDVGARLQRSGHGACLSPQQWQPAAVAAAIDGQIARIRPTVTVDATSSDHLARIVGELFADADGGSQCLRLVDRAGAP